MKFIQLFSLVWFLKLSISTAVLPSSSFVQGTSGSMTMYYTIFSGWTRWYVTFLDNKQPLTYYFSIASASINGVSLTITSGGSIFYAYESTAQSECLATFYGHFSSGFSGAITSYVFASSADGVAASSITKVYNFPIFPTATQYETITKTEYGIAISTRTTDVVVETTTTLIFSSETTEYETSVTGTVVLTETITV